MQRRNFLRMAALTTGIGLLPIGGSGWAATGGTGGKRLIVVFLRGAVDGLNVVVPHGDANYYAARPSIAIARGPGGVIDLDGHFGLHPALAGMLPLWQQKNLAFIQAAGSPDPSRSHFDAQLMMETGTPGTIGTKDGWLNRLLAMLPGPASPTRGVNFGPVVPRIISGKVQVANIGMGKAAAKPTPLDRPDIAASFGSLYSGTDALSTAFREGQESRKELLAHMDEEQIMADNGAPQPDGFPADARRLAHLIAKDPSIQIAFLALGGWDTHVNQGNVKGQLGNHLQPLGDGLAALAQGLGPAYQDTVILVISEFGRTVHENGNGGTDHGHGNVVWAMGGPIAGGKVYGAWPGLSSDRLYQGRDLAITTDFRIPIAAVLERHLLLPDRDLNAVFPAMPAGSGSMSGLVKA